MPFYSPEAPILVELATDVTHTQSSEVLEDVTGMSFPVENGGTYVWTLYLHQNSAANADIDIAYSAPAGAGFHMKTSSTGSTSAITAEVASDGGGADVFNIYHGFFQPTAGGTVQLRFAQNTSQASDTKVLDGTSLIIWRSA